MDPKNKGKRYTLTEEIFSVGIWNGIPFSLNDLKAMAASFHSLKEKLKVPLKIGHNDDQPLMEDGHPSFGWITDLKVDMSSKPEKLIATIEDVPEIVYNAIQSKLYRTKSAEIEFGVKDKDQFYDLVVTAVAILGADLPAVHNLNDLGQYVSPGAGGGGQSGARLNHSGKRVMFAIINNQPEEESTMTPEQIKAMQEENARLLAENATSKQFKADREAADKAAAVTARGEKRKKITAIFEKAVTDKVITPAKRTSFEKILRITDDNAVDALDLAEVETLIAAEKPVGKKFNREAEQEDEAHDDEEPLDLEPGETPDMRLSKLVSEQLDEKGWDRTQANFEKATRLVFGKNKALARAYMNQNNDE